MGKQKRSRKEVEQVRIGLPRDLCPEEEGEKTEDDAAEACESLELQTEQLPRVVKILGKVLENEHNSRAQHTRDQRVERGIVNLAARKSELWRALLGQQDRGEEGNDEHDPVTVDCDPKDFE